MSATTDAFTASSGWPWITRIALVAACGRVAAATWAAISATHGDYYASLPGTYVRTLNPTLWNSPDMQGAMGYHLDTYYHGPVQYLTLYPLAYLDSYAQIAWVLLPIYALVLATAFWVLRQCLTTLAPTTPVGVPLFATMFLFFPVLQSYIQREFEVVILLGLSVALLHLLRNRVSASAAWLAYVVWFKYVPLLFVAYLGLRGWARAIAVFVLTSIAILGLAHAVFGLPEFVNNNVPAHAAQVMSVTSFGFRTDAAGDLVGEGFCTGWFENETTLANVRHGLCSIGSVAPWLPPNVIYLLLCGAVASIYLATHFRLARIPRLAAEDEAWRRAVEFSIVTTVCATFVFAHYYYLIVLVIPFSVLLARYLPTRRRGHMALWILSYGLVSAFVIPVSVLSRLFGVDVWAGYMRGAWFLYGELLLVGLLLCEYWSIGRPSPTAYPRSCRAVAI